MALKFDSLRCYKDFIGAIADKFKEYGEQIKNEMKKEIIGSSTNPDWVQDVSNSIDFVLTQSAMKVGIECGMIHSQEDFSLMFKAFITNYGMGRFMDASRNEWLSEYLSSSYYNSKRPPDHTVLSRPGETYFDPDKGWVQSKAKTQYSIPQFSQRPSYWFDNTVTKYMKQSTLDDIISRTFSEFDFGKYLIES